MPILMPTLQALRRFLADQRGSVTIEALIVWMTLMWAFLAVWVYFDAFRVKSVNARAAYTISDVLSREGATSSITPAYLDGLFALQGQLNLAGGTRQLRVTAYSFDADRNRYVVRWSQARGGATPLTDAALDADRALLPVMANNRWAVRIDTWVGYSPDFAIAGIEPFVFEDTVVANLRFTPKLCWNSSNTGGLATEVC